jgi:hypothetical protein
LEKEKLRVQAILFSPQCFQKAFFPDPSKGVGMGRNIMENEKMLNQYLILFLQCFPLKVVKTQDCGVQGSGFYEK